MAQSLSNIHQPTVSIIIKKFITMNLHLELLSTEEMCGALETFTTRTAVIFSMDVVAMYLNLHHEGVARTCGEEFLRLDLLNEEVDTKALIIYILHCHLSRTL